MPDDRRHVDDASAGVGEQHAADDLFGQVQRTRQIDRNQPVDRLVGHRGQDTVEGHAGTIHQPVGASETAFGPFDERGQIGRHGNVARLVEEIVSPLRFGGEFGRISAQRADAIPGVQQRFDQNAPQPPATAADDDVPVRVVAFIAHDLLLRTTLPAADVSMASTTFKNRGR